VSSVHLKLVTCQNVASQEVSQMSRLKNDHQSDLQEVVFKRNL